MSTRTLIAGLALLGGVAAGCSNDPNHMSRTGRDYLPDSGTSNGAVDGSGGVGGAGGTIGTNNPTVNGAGAAESNGGARGDNTLMPGTTGSSVQNAGSGSPSGATGTAASP